MNRFSRLLQDLTPGLLSVRLAVGFIGKLLRNKDSWVILFHLKRSLHTFFNACADISLIMDQDHFCSIVLHQFSSLFTNRVRHNDFCLVPFYCPDQSQANSLVAAGWFHDNRIRADLPFLFCCLDHIQRSPGLDRTSHIHCLKFHQHLCILRAGHTVQPDQRRIPYCFQNVMVYHILTFLTLKIPVKIFFL